MWLLAAGVCLALLLLVAVGNFYLWAEGERSKIPVEDRRSWPEILRAARTELPGLLRGLRDDWREHRAVRRRMDANARRARRDIYESVYERTREELRRNGDL